MRKEFISPTDVHQPRGYSHAVKAGNTIFVAGQVGWDEERRIAQDSFELQTVQAFENLKRVLEASGATLKDVVKINIYLKDLNDLPKFREIRERYFQPPYPASTLVQIVSLAFPELLIEIEAVALVDQLP